jgi:small conductance mechanosensitive channel
MDLNVEELTRASLAWWPLLLQYSGRLILALLTLTIGWWIINHVTGRATSLLRGRRVDQTLVGFLGNVASVALKIMLVISVASMIGIETTSFIAALGAAGLAVGLALQGSLSNFAGGVLILLFRPFRQGDFIQAQGITGTVDSIQIFHTTLKTGDNKVVVMPNGSLSNGVITNFNREPRRRLEFSVGISYDSDIKLARKILLEIVDDPRVLKDPAPAVNVTALGDNSVTLMLLAWTATGDLGGVNNMVIEETKERFAAEGIDLPFPQRTVHLVHKQDTPPAA